MGNDIITNYNVHNILLKVNEIYPDNNGVLWELEAQNVNDIANIYLYIDELQKKLNAKVILKEPLEYPKVCIYVNYSENLLNAYNNFKSRL